MRKLLLALVVSLMTSSGVLFAAEPEAPSSAEPAAPPKAEWELAVEAAEKAYIDKQHAKIDENIAKAMSLAGDDTIRATIQNQLGVIRLHQRRYADAQKAFGEAVELRTKTAGPADPATCLAMGNLALVEHKLGNEKKAEELYKKCIEGKRRVDPMSPSVALSLTNLAHLYADEKRCKEAKTLYAEALGIDSTAYGANHKEVALDLFNLGALLYHCNSFLEAIPYLERSKRVYAALNDDMGKAKVLHYIALCQTGLHQPQKAAEAALAALQTHEHFKGKGHQDALVHLLNAADSIDATGDSTRAEKMYKQALSSAEASKEPSNYRLTECNLELGEFYARHNAPDRAEHYFKRALVHYDLLPKRDRRTLYELPLAYSKLLSDLKRTEEADALSARYLSVYEPTRTNTAVKVEPDATQR